MRDYSPAKRWVVNTISLLAALFLVVTVVVPNLSLAAKGGNNPGSGNSNNGNGSSGGIKGELYGDLWVIVRDANGEPILFSWAEDEEGIYLPSYTDSRTGCLQPIANTTTEALPAGLVALADMVNWEVFTEVFGTDLSTGLAGLPLIPLDGDCEIIGEDYTQEVDFGRLSVARSPVAVIDSALEEALTTIRSGIAISSDPAGRIVVHFADDSQKTIDAPLENLALYKQLMLTGSIFTDDSRPSPGNELDNLFDNSLTREDLNVAAAFLSASGDKTGTITLDLVININTILGINTAAGYFDFENVAGVQDNTYGYYRGVTNESYCRNPTVYDSQSACGMFSGVQATLILPSNKEGTVVSALTRQTITLLEDAYPQVFNDVAPTDLFSNTAARGFTQAADDSLKVINYIHNWALPDLPEGWSWQE
ncbi:hypothetical protein ABHF91_14570 [Pseudaeromonas sp. ZJS20]|uniref:hypothetical protein n=1 Tax=Pseudaeromonas aegiceratis TaxID=3153928 RepID=UPI00390CC3EA